MTMDVDNAQSSMPREELVELLQNLRLVKQLSVSFLDWWAANTDDPEIRAVLPRHAARDRDMLAALSQRLADLGHAPDDAYEDEHIAAVFDALRDADIDALRLVGFYRALKGYLIARYNMLTALGDPASRSLMEDLVEDEEEMQRWGEGYRSRMSVSSEDMVRVAQMEAQVQILTARSRERIAHGIRERAEETSGGVIDKRLGDLARLMQQAMGNDDLTPQQRERLQQMMGGGQGMT